MNCANIFHLFRVFYAIFFHLFQFLKDKIHHLFHILSRMDFGVINRQKDRGTSMAPLCFRSQPSRWFRVRLTLFRPQHPAHPKERNKAQRYKKEESGQKPLSFSV